MPPSNKIDLLEATASLANQKYIVKAHYVMLNSKMSEAYSIIKKLKTDKNKEKLFIESERAKAVLKYNEAIDLLDHIDVLRSQWEERVGKKC